DSGTGPELMRSNADWGRQRGWQRFKDTCGGLHGDDVAVWAQTANDTFHCTGQLRMAVELVAGMNVRYVDLDDRPVEGLESIVDRNGRERVAGRVDNDGVRALTCGLDE